MDDDGWLVKEQCVKLLVDSWTVLVHACRRRSRRCIECLVLSVYCICVYAVWNATSPQLDPHSPAADPSLQPRGRYDVSRDVTSVAGRRRRDVIAHVTWFYPPRTALRFHEAMCLLAVQRYVRPRKILLWYDAASTPPAGAWWQFARQSVAHLLPVPYERPTSVYNRTVLVPEHQSDVVRLAVLEEFGGLYVEFGGLYVDLDVIVVRPLDPLLVHDVTLGAESPSMLGSGFILATRTNATFVRLWRHAYADFDDSDWNRHSVYVPMQNPGVLLGPRGPTGPSLNLAFQGNRLGTPQISSVGPLALAMPNGSLDSNHYLQYLRASIVGRRPYEVIHNHFRFWGCGALP